MPAWPQRGLSALFTWKRGIKRGAADPAKPKCLKNRLFKAAGQHRLQITSAGRDWQGGRARLPGNTAESTVSEVPAKSATCWAKEPRQRDAGRVAWLWSQGWGCVGTGLLSGSWTVCRPLSSPSCSSSPVKWREHLLWRVSINIKKWDESTSVVETVKTLDVYCHEKKVNWLYLSAVTKYRLGG